MGSKDSIVTKVFGALKLIRVLRLNKIITILRSTEEIKAFLKLLKLIFFLAIYLHIYGCILWLIVNDKKIWIPPMDYNAGQTNFFFVYEQDWWYKYLTCLHGATMLLCGNDLGPRDTFQVYFQSFGIFMGCIINANIFGELAVLVAQLNMKTTAFQEKLTRINTTLFTLNLDKDLEERVRDYFIISQSSQTNQEELTQFLILLSPSLKAKMIYHEFHAIIKNLSVFSFKDSVTKAVLDRLTLRLFKCDDLILSQGEISKSIFFISVGTVEIKKEFDSPKPYFIKFLQSGDMFGHRSVVLGCRNLDTAIAKNYSTLAALNVDDYHNISQQFPSLTERIFQLVHNNPVKK